MFEFNMVLSYGITFGILMMSIIYTSIKYAYSKELFYLSYSLMQLFSLFYIAAYSKLFTLSELTQEISLVLASAFAIAFAFGYSKGSLFPKIKNQKELILYTVLLVIIIATAFYHYVLFEYLPYTIIYFLIFISLVFNLKDEVKTKSVYVIGWTLFCLFVYFTDFKDFYYHQGFIDLVLVAFAIEALLFTISVAYSYKSIESEKFKYEDMLFHQSRLAKSGAMIGNITHQFRQPLNNISYILINIKNTFEKGDMDEVYLNKKVTQASSQLQYMSKTIDDFKAFYEPDKTKRNFEVKDAINQAITIIDAELKQKSISLTIDYENNEDLQVFGISNELSQIVLNLLTNAKDALKNIESPQIKIEVKSTTAEVMIDISDNAKGVKNINKIFDAYYTTKEDGFGIGLYLVKTIIEESFNGKIEATNLNEGAKFSLIFEKAI